MTFATDIADDQDIWDDVETETVTLRTRRDGGDKTDITLANARRLPLRRDDQQFASIQLSSDAIRWVLKENEVTSTGARQGDLILVGTVGSPDEVWKIQQASKETFGTLWSCLCVLQ